MPRRGFSRALEIGVPGVTRAGMLEASLTESFMAKRIMISLVGAGIGSLAGLLVSFLGGGNLALILGAVVGAVIPLAVMGSPGR